MPTPNITAAAVDALARRAEQATGVDGINVDKDVLAALIEGWRCWQMVEAMPAITRRTYRTYGSHHRFQPSRVRLIYDAVTKEYWLEAGIGSALTWYSGAGAPDSALRAALKEGTDGE